MTWYKYEEVKPSEDGNYLVAYSNPYEQDFSYKIAYCHRQRFENDKAGGNHIIFWREIPKITNTDKHYYRIAYNKKVCLPQ